MHDRGLTRALAVSAGLLLLTATLVGASPAAAQQPRNIIIMFADEAAPTQWDFGRYSSMVLHRQPFATSGAVAFDDRLYIGQVFKVGPSNGTESLLEVVDVISAVSGGSSALAWYLVQHYHAADSKDLKRALFDPTGSYQTYLGANFTTFAKGEYPAGVTVDVLAAPLNFLANGLFGWHMNTSPMRRWYEERLYQTFQRVPDQATALSVSAPTVEELGEFIKKRPNAGLPFFVINTTALIERDFHHYGAKLGNSVFEFNALNFRSDAYGKHPYKDGPLEGFATSRAVSLSSAAFDGALLVSGPSQSTLWSILNLDTGMYVDNPNLAGWKRVLHRFRPFPSYFFSE